MKSSIIKRKDDISLFASWFFTIAIIVLIALVTLEGLKPRELTYKLTDKQKLKIILQVKVKGYNDLVKSNCSGIVAEFIKTNEWKDIYCYSKYNHLDLR